MRVPPLDFILKLVSDEIVILENSQVKTTSLTVVAGRAARADGPRARGRARQPDGLVDKYNQQVQNIVSDDGRAMYAVTDDDPDHLPREIWASRSERCERWPAALEHHKYAGIGVTKKKGCAKSACLVHASSSCVCNFPLIVIMILVPGVLARVRAQFLI